MEPIDRATFGRRGLLAGGVAAAAGAVAGCTPAEPAAPPASAGAPAEQVGADRYRPRFHYTPLTGHLADPNGLVFAAGVYHLFHQADGTWAHATSTDLAHWQRRPEAFGHDTDGQALSGSAVLDADNRSDLVPGGGLVALYTNTEGGEAQSVAFSSDGLSWQRFADNPVLANDGRKDFRDPKVFWHGDTGRWIMIVSTGGTVTLFGSADLRQWRRLSELGAGQGLHSAVWECPDLFSLTDPSGRRRWVLTVSVGDSVATAGSTMQYFVGDFDGTTFTNSGPADRVRVVDAGQDFYAAQTWSGLSDERRVWLGWMGNWRYPYQLPTGDWHGTMSIPRELSLIDVGGDLRLLQQPVAELQALRETAQVLSDVTVDQTRPVPLDPVDGVPLGRSAEFELIFTPGAGRSGLRVLGDDQHHVEIGVDRTGPELYVDRSQAGLETITDRSGAPFGFGLRRSASLGTVPGSVRLRGYVDNSTIEVFDDLGHTLSLTVFPPDGATAMELFADGGAARIERLTVWPMRAGWA